MEKNAENPLEILNQLNKEMDEIYHSYAKDRNDDPDEDKQELCSIRSLAAASPPSLIGRRSAAASQIPGILDRQDTVGIGLPGGAPAPVP